MSATAGHIVGGTATLSLGLSGGSFFVGVGPAEGIAGTATLNYNVGETRGVTLALGVQGGAGPGARGSAAVSQAGTSVSAGLGGGGGAGASGALGYTFTWKW